MAAASQRASLDREQEEYYVASQWQLMWWKFRKHKLASIAGPIIIILYLGAIFCGFLSPAVPGMRFEDYKYAPPVKIHFGELESGNKGLFIYDMEGTIDSETFRRTYIVDEGVKYPIRFFVRGEPYKILGLIPMDVHLFGSDEGAPLFLLGTDRLGRDLFTRVLYGSQISLSIGLVGVAITFIVGLLIGGISGYFGGIVDTVIQRIIDMIVCIPTIPLWMALAAAMPRDWPITHMYFAIVLITSLIGWVGLARVVRGKILSLREEDFCMAAKIAGASDMYIIVRHMIPSFMSYILVSLTLSIPSTILGETSLSFLGLGLQPPAVSWGVLIQDAQNLQTVAHNPWLLWPAAWIIVTVLMFNFLGDGLRDAADPYK